MWRKHTLAEKPTIISAVQIRKLEGGICLPIRFASLFFLLSYKVCVIMILLGRGFLWWMLYTLGGE